MTAYAIYNKETGQIYRTGEAPEETVQLMLDSDAVNYVVDVEASDELHYVDVSQTPPVIAEIPSRPTLYHEWEWYAHEWIENVEAAKEAVKNSIDSIRLSRMTAPITYDDKTLDADSTAISNLSGKLEELTARAALGLDISLKNLVWRDYHNITHSWDSIAEYKGWLEGLAIAIAERTSTLYMIAWSMKDEVNDLTTVIDVINYDIWQGWDV